MPEPTPEQQSTIDSQVQQFQWNNYQAALNQVRALSIHCVLFVIPQGKAATINEEQKAFLHAQLMQVANLYAPGKATV